MNNLTELLNVANRLADAARLAVLRHFRKAGLEAGNKLAGGFDPVTAADREAERAMRDLLAELRPDDGVTGEEHANTTGSSGLTWVLDPVDGTRSFICGAPVFGVLIAVNQGEGPQLGVIDQPWTGERFIGAKAAGIAEMRRGDERYPLKTRQCAALSEATLLTTFPEVGTAREREGFQAVSAKTRLTRYGLDCYGYALLALGQVDLVIEAGLQPYDVQGPIAVIEAAGGVVTNWRGGPAHQGGQVIAAGDPALHRKALELLAPFAA